MRSRRPAFGLVHRGIVDVADHDARPVLARGTGERAADAVAAAGDDDHISIRRAFDFPIRRSAVRQYGDGVYFDQIIGRSELVDFDHGGSGKNV